ncbi:MULTISPECIES: phasin family protein [unclassified Rickettsia]|uniref:phasin family protein n=1 Tax=unclassified Rickettsia TaxID=114295 RepID=UPI00209C90F4|nr:phasin family protein [Rickettsia endosymbiont of Ceutorhynchus assimilis]
MLNNTQFLDMMKSYMNPEAYMSSIKNIPNVDLSSVTGTIQRAMNIFTTTNQIAIESMQTLIKKNSEILQSNVNNIVNSTKEAMNSGDIKQAADCHQQCLKSVYETSINNAKELANIAYESSAKILEAVNKNVAENVHHAAENVQKKK